MDNASDDTLTCSFCGRTDDKCQQMIVQGAAVICDQCVLECVKILVDTASENKVSTCRNRQDNGTSDH